MPKVHVQCKRTRPNVTLPEYATEGSVGLDLATAEAVNMEAGELALIPTGLVVKTPPGHMLMLVPRSSTYRKYGITMPHGVGVIDQDYCGPEDELLLQFLATEECHIPEGTRIAQAVFVPVTKVALDENTALDQLSRGGFGSTDA